MKNETILKQAIELLQNVDPDELETVQVNHTKYDDGSIGFTVDLTYPPATETTVMTFEDGSKEIDEVR